MEGKKAI